MAMGTSQAQAQARGKLLDYEQYIDHQLRRTRTQIKKIDALSAGLMLVTVALAILFLEVILDHALSLPLWVRRIILLVGGGSGIAYAAVSIIRPLLASVNGMYAAKTIELSEPDFKNGLINYLALRKDRENLPKSFLAAIEAKAVSQLTKVDVEGVVNQRRVLKTAYALSAIVVVFCIYSLFGPKSIWDSTKRAFLADVAPPTDTRLVNLEPGRNEQGLKVVAGSHVPFTVEIEGKRPEKVMLHYSIDGGDFFAEQEVAPGKNFYDKWQTTLRNVQRGVDYYMTGGDARTETFHIEVLPAPLVTGVTLDYDFPEYTGVADRKGVEGGTIDVIEGTLVTVHARTSEPAVDGKLNLIGKNVSYNMVPKADDMQEIVGKFQVAENGSYTVTFRAANLQPNPEPVVYEILARKDFPPTAKIVKPTSSIKLPANGKVAVIVEASDDFGIKDVFLSVHEGTNRRGFNNLVMPPVPQRNLTGSFDLDLSKLDTPPQPGTRLQYWVTVRDTKEPRPNKVETAKYEIEVAEPAKKEELAKLDKAAEQEKKEANEANKAQQGQAREELAQNDPGENRADNGDGQGQKGNGVEQPADGKAGDEKNQLALNDQPKERRGQGQAGGEPPQAPGAEAGKPNEQDRNKMKQLEQMLKSQPQPAKNPANRKAQGDDSKAEPNATAPQNQGDSPPSADNSPNKSQAGREGVSTPDRKTTPNSNHPNSPPDQKRDTQGSSEADSANQISRSQPDERSSSPQKLDPGQSPKDSKGTSSGGSKDQPSRDLKNQIPQENSPSPKDGHSASEGSQRDSAKPETDLSNASRNGQEKTREKSGKPKTPGDMTKPQKRDALKSADPRSPSSDGSGQAGVQDSPTNPAEPQKANPGDATKTPSDGAAGQDKSSGRDPAKTRPTNPETTKNTAATGEKSGRREAGDPTKRDSSHPIGPNSGEDSKDNKNPSSARNGSKGENDAAKADNRSDKSIAPKPTQEPEKGSMAAKDKTGDESKAGSERKSGSETDPNTGKPEPGSEKSTTNTKPNPVQTGAKSGSGTDPKTGTPEPGSAKSASEPKPTPDQTRMNAGASGEKPNSGSDPNSTKDKAAAGQDSKATTDPMKSGEKPSDPNGSKGSDRNQESGGSKGNQTDGKTGDSAPEPAKEGSGGPSAKKSSEGAASNPANGEKTENTASTPGTGSKPADQSGGEPDSKNNSGKEAATKAGESADKAKTHGPPDDSGLQKPEGEGQSTAQAEKSSQSPKAGASAKSPDSHEKTSVDPSKAKLNGSEKSKSGNSATSGASESSGPRDSSQPGTGDKKPDDQRGQPTSDSPSGNEPVTPGSEADAAKATPTPGGADSSNMKPTPVNSDDPRIKGQKPSQISNSTKPAQKDASQATESNQGNNAAESPSGANPEADKEGSPGKGNSLGQGQKGDRSKEGQGSEGKGPQGGTTPGDGKPGEAPKNSNADSKSGGEANQAGEGTATKSASQPASGGEPGSSSSDSGTSSQGSSGKRQRGGNSTGTATPGRHPGDSDMSGQKGDPSSTGQVGKGTQPGGEPSTGKQTDNPDKDLSGKGTEPSQQKNAPSSKSSGSNGSGGGDDKPGAAPGAPKEDKSTPPPDSSGQVPQNPAESIAPDTQGSNLVIRTIQDLLKENKVTPEVEKRFDMSRDQMEQFVKKKWEKGNPRPAVGPGREVKVSPNAPERTFDPNRKAPGGLPNATVSNRNERSGVDTRTDDVKGLAEGAQVAAPKALRSRYDAYKTSIGRSTVGSRRTAAPATK